MNARFLTPVIVIMALLIYLVGAKYHADYVNTNMREGDQVGYMHTAEAMHESQFRYMGDRNRMPLYSWVLSALYRERIDYDSFFQRGKYLNIAISVFLIMIAYFLLTRDLRLANSVNLIFITTFTLYIFRSGYVQCEIIFYSLSFYLFWMMIKFLIHPTFKLAAVMGVTAGLTHLSKGSALAGIFLFIGFMFMQRLSEIMLSKAKDHDLKPIFMKTLAGFLFVMCFFAVIFPYIQDSKKIFGRYFYNVNTTFYAWVDSGPERNRLTRAHGDRVGWPDMPADDIPSPSKYLREHTWGDILERIVSGLIRLKREFAVSYGYQYITVQYLIFAFLGCILAWKKIYSWALAHRWLVSFGIVYFGVYIILYAWAVPMNRGPRFMLANFLPAMYVVMLIIQFTLRDRYLAFKRFRIPWPVIFHSCTASTFLYFLPRLIQQLTTTYAGN